MGQSIKPYRSGLSIQLARFHMLFDFLKLYFGQKLVNSFE